jgi:hypothetical protein
MYIFLGRRHRQHFITKEPHRSLDFVRRYLTDIHIEQQVAHPGLSQLRNLLRDPPRRTRQEGVRYDFGGRRRLTGLMWRLAAGVILLPRRQQVRAVAFQGQVSGL